MAIENDKLKSRESFANSLVDVIKEECGQNEHAYIIGLSGSWGSGKTYVLDNIASKLLSSKRPKYVVVNVDAWKYADQPTFLRALLLGLKTGSGREDAIDDLTRSTSQTKVRPVALLIYFIVILALPVVAWYLGNFFSVNIGLADYLQRVVELESPLIIPAIIVFGLQYYGVFNVTTPTIKTLDKFEAVFDDLLTKHEKAGKKVVIIIDNLDRLLPEAALNILGSLRTVADKKGVVYLVAADSPVLSRGIGNQIMDGDDNSAQYGSSYLRKTFDLYWPLPELTNEELAIFVKGKIAVRFLSSALSESEGSEVVDLIVAFGRGNLRVIERIVERFRFELYIIHQYVKDDSMTGEQLKALKSLSSQPLLLLKVQIIQEFWPYLYTSLKSHRYGELLDLEKLSYAGIEPFKSKFVEYYNDGNSEDAHSLKQFLSSKHPFFLGGVATIYNLGILTALSVETNPSDDRSKSTQTFVSELVDGETDTVRNAILQYSPEALKAQSPEILKSLNDLQIETFAAGFSNLLFALAVAEPSDIEQYRPLIDAANSLKRWSELKEQSAGVKERVSRAIAAYLTSPAAQYSTQMSELNDFIQYPGTDDSSTANAGVELKNLEGINDANAWGTLQLALSWVIRADVANDNYESLAHFYQLACTIKEHYRFDLLKPSVEVGQDICQRWGAMEPKNRALVLAYFDVFNLTDQLDTLRSVDDSLFDRNDHSEIGKALATISELKQYDIKYKWLSVKDIEDQLINHIKATPDIREAFQYGVSMLGSFADFRNDRVWTAMMHSQEDYLDKIITDPTLLDLVTGPDYAPSEELGSQLFTQLMHSIQSQSVAERSNCELLKRMNKDRAIWSNVKINRNSFIKKCSDACTQDLQSLRSSWGLK